MIFENNVSLVLYINFCMKEFCLIFDLRYWFIRLNLFFNIWGDIRYIERYNELIKINVNY